MAQATPIRIGQINNGGAQDALFLKVFSGEVLTAFEEANQTLDKHMIRTIASGRSAQFPATWKVGAQYHTPGAEIVGQTSPVNERVISIDQLLISDVFIPLIDEAMNHYDYRSEYSKQSGLALAYQWDRNILQVGVLAARASPTVVGGDGGTSLISSGTLYRTSAADIISGLFGISQAMDEKHVPQSEEKYAYMRPAQYYLLAQQTTLVSKDFSDSNGDYAKATTLRAGGCQLVKTNHLPITNIVSGPVAYQGDFSRTSVLVMAKPAVGTVKLLDMSSEMAYDIRRQGTLIVSKYAIGHGILRPECAGELRTTT